MPFLRRRGNLASETDMRRHSNTFAPSSSEDIPDLPAQLQPRISETTGELLSQQQSRESATNRPRTPPVQQQTNKHRRFSVLRFRNASDSQLSLRAKQQAERPPPVPRPPAIITTAPTNDMTGQRKPATRMGLASRLRRSVDVPRHDTFSGHSLGSREETQRKSFTEDTGRSSTNVLEEAQLSRPPTQATNPAVGLGLATIAHRQSESSRSDASSTECPSHCPSQPSPNATPKKSHIAPFFKLRRTKRPPEPLFPLAHLQHKNMGPPPSSSSTSLGVANTPRPNSAQSTGTPRGDSGQAALSGPAAAFFASGNGPRSGHSSPTRASALRGRSSTMSSLGRDSTDDHLLPPTSRTSTSTGRKSFGDLLGLSRLRQNSELSRQGSLTPATPGSIGSKSNSLQLPRDSVILPERIDDESPSNYVARLEDVIGRGIIAAALCKGTDPFSAAALRSYMRTFSFFGDPMDMSIRKLLMEAELPKETQQIDRCLQAFANRYHECNPGIYSSPDQAYFIAFSLLILHTDVFNKNNKHKMQKADYLKNTRGEGIYDEILECFYDNICYTPFIHVEDDLDSSSERFTGSKSRHKQLIPGAAGDVAKRAYKEPIDPYTLILDGNLDVLRPNLKDAMPLEDHYSYLGSAKSLNLKDLQKTFFRTGVLQIVSARSRPDAFMTDQTLTNPDDAHPGIVDIKITKVGLLWRKDPKRRKTRSPWQEWGVILTGAQLYFFRNTSWVKSLMHQYENHIKGGHDGIPITFKPPLEEFKPDALMSTYAAVALLDKSYKKHKHAFVYVRQGGLDEVLLADDEDELNDWLAKLNYAAAFRTSGARMRGVTGAHYDGQGRRGMRRLDSSDASHLIQTPTGPVSIVRGQIDHKMAEDIQTARRDVMRQKIHEADRKIEEFKKAVEEQLKNARHLQIMAPIQPRTRDQLLSAAGRMSAQLKWTYMEMWRERCHRDILSQDLEEDFPTNDPDSPVKKLTHNETHLSPTPQTVTMTRSESNNGQQGEPELLPSTLIDACTTASENSHEGAPMSVAPLMQASQVGPLSFAEQPLDSRDPSHSRSDNTSIRHGSISSVTASSVQSPASPLQTRPAASRDGDGDDVSSLNGPSHTQEEVDADERQFLMKAGLLDARSNRDPSEKASISNPTDFVEYATSSDRDKFERSKIRRSLQRTLREGAGHLSHHRSKKGKEIPLTSTVDDVVRDSTLARGTGSFVVHGKKASVIKLGTELQSMSNEEHILARKQTQQQQHPQPQPQSSQRQSSIYSSGQDDDDLSVVNTPVESYEFHERRESAASTNTATARSFRELHRRYSTAQAARSVSAGGRLAIPSDGESEAAVSFCDGRRSPLPPIETQGGEKEYIQSRRAIRHDDDDDDGELRVNGKPPGLEYDQDGELRPWKHGLDSDEEESADTLEPEHVRNQPIQSVNT